MFPLIIDLVQCANKPNTMLYKRKSGFTKLSKKLRRKIRCKVINSSPYKKIKQNLLCLMKVIQSLSVIQMKTSLKKVCHFNKKIMMLDCHEHSFCSRKNLFDFLTMVMQTKHLCSSLKEIKNVSVSRRKSKLM